MDLQDLLMRSTLDSMFKVGFGFDLDTLSGSNEASNRSMEAFDESNGLVYWRFVDLWKVKRYLNIGSEAALKEKIKIIDNFVYELIQNKRKQLKNEERFTRNVLLNDDILSIPFVSELLTTLPTTIVDLEPHQIHASYEYVGYMIQAESEETERDEYLLRLMDLPNQQWVEIIGYAHGNMDLLKDQDVIRIVLNILKTNTSVATGLGTDWKVIFAPDDGSCARN
ncbi:unnamed protein product [Lactuca virosa]|uniref:Uncharacterized protein n=1 Tax=Lactuca virosa TaxID=75947 RepID=A0AAU9PWQ1_9ASTR|nr:unnamed protein product [Lactuca virosa]